MRIVCFSDTHKKHRDVVLPDGDVLVFAGDMCGRGGIQSVRRFNEWLGEQPHHHKIVVAGNHDRPFENFPYREMINEISNAVYLEDCRYDIDGLVFYGSPWQPEFCNWAFNLPRGEPLRSRWRHISDHTDVLITHGPPANVMDECDDGQRVGCMDLSERIDELDLKLHVFGHIHHSYGVEKIGATTYVNACVCDEDYVVSNPPIVIDL